MRPLFANPRPLSTALLLCAALAPHWALGVENDNDADPSGQTDTAHAPAAAQPATAAPTEATFDQGRMLTDLALLQAAQGVAWSEASPQGPLRWLLLTGGDTPVVFKIGSHGFVADRALVRVLTKAGTHGPEHHLSLYLDNAQSLGDDTVGAKAPRLLVTAVTSGKVQVAAPLLTQARAAPFNDFAAAGRARIQGQRKQPGQAQEQGRPGPATDAFEELKAGKERRAARRAERQTTLNPTGGANAANPQKTDDKTTLPTLPGLPGGDGADKKGPIHSSADRLVFQRAGQKDAKSGVADPQDTLLLMGHVRLSWEVQGRLVEARAENVVIFLDASADGKLDDASKISGIYLEDNAIIGDGDHMVRAPRIYFDVVHNRATLLDAVMYAVDAKIKVPLHLRARLLRQHAADSFEARGLTVSNNAFAEPDFAIGAGRLTLSSLPQKPGQSDGPTRVKLTLSDATPQIVGVPVAWLPYVALPNWQIPLRSIYAGYGTNDGPSLRTRWGVHELLGEKPAAGEDLTVDFDWRGQHGAGLGLNRKYDRPEQDHFGNFQFYDLPAANGIDRIAGRTNLPHQNEHRYFLRFEHRHRLSEETQLTVQGAHASDPTMQEMFFPTLAERPPETGLDLKHTHEDWSLAGIASLQTTDFSQSLTELEARGWQTEQLQGEFRRLGTEVGDGKANWFSENRVGRVRAAVGTDAPIVRGITNLSSLQDFGATNTTSFRTMAAARGVPTAWVNRFDSRQEVAIPLQSGPVDVTPFAVMRYTQWSDGIENTRGAEDSKRLYGGGGVRLATEISGTSSDLKSAWLDINGLRHVMRPEVDLGWYGSSMDSSTLPMYDPDVEGLGEGGIARFGLVNTWQTHRGEGRNRHLVDWLRLKQDVVLRSGEDDPHRAIPRHVDWRPEYALGGSHIYSELLWQTTDALSTNGEATYTFDSDRIEQWGMGFDYAHSDRLTSRLGYRETRMFDEQLVSYGVQYRLTPKYDLSVNHTFNLGEIRTGWVNTSLDRKTPGGILRLIGSYDELNGAYSIGIAFSPSGFGGGNGLSQSLYRRNPD